MIEAEGVSFAYGATEVLHGASLRARPGRVLGLIGPNGSGKTTLLRTLYGSLRPSAGSVRLDGTALSELSALTLATRLAVVVQEHGGDVPLTVADMVMLGRSPHLGTFSRAGGHDEEVAEGALLRVGALHLADRPFAALSGGERQRVLLARALAQEADHLLLDEPTNHLDVRYQHEVLALVRGLGTTVVVVLHDLGLAERYCDDLVLLQGGRVVATGTPAEVLVPGVLEPVYEVRVRRVEVDGEAHLALRPRDPARPGPAAGAVPAGR
ncbi:ABC transporter ATP-binding protein [Vallicoccus soli]|uniref:ABC transporter ATP-binding protein n=1 Tax=Vallicoccus soli TaxID=2339232 RepID=A0A3A3ZB37_9ACTN|nr:ABC transporter ATP-binding protein [Vallicoccus soli]RJK98316.1 ABC transporter ATP-binding protein [Vallicoccus soli]